ncbi:MAG: phosphoglycerate dehydrogenase [Candidatus Peregrinibacteria bacterium Greene0416_19]|nr:MAG: phosphoglycerate dehydrogenase [Candidatus Peregrinibacteria bacterium Greene0416_19]
MTRIVFLDVDPEDQALVAGRFQEAVIKGTLPEKEVIASCDVAEIVSCFITTAFPKKVLDRLPSLKLLVTRSVGYDHIDADACRGAGVALCNVPDYGSHVIAEHVFALLLATLRHIHEGDARVEGGQFDYHGLRGIALRGKTIGIVGTGKIGRRVAQIAHGFGMKILATDKCRTLELEDLLGVRYVPLTELLAGSDIVTLHMPALPETHHLFDAERFAQMKDGAILVNTARGSLIDSRALLEALHAGKLSHALLDVLEHEQNFEQNRALVNHPKVVTTPHIAFYADDSMRNMYLDAFESIDQWTRGKTPDHVVKPVNVVCDLPGIAKR